MITDKLHTEMPFSDVADIATLDNERGNTINFLNNNMSTNNDCLVELDPDHNTLDNCTVKKCSNYDTSIEFNKTFCSQNNIYILHLNICCSQHKLTDLTYYLDNLNIIPSFIGISETWATKFNYHVLNIPGYLHEQCIRSNNRKGGGTSIYIHKDIQYKNRNDISLPKNTMSQYLLK